MSVLMSTLVSLSPLLHKPGTIHAWVPLTFVREKENVPESFTGSRLFGLDRQVLTKG